MRTFEPERLFEKDGKIYLLQNPFYNNCVVVALFNAFLDDDQHINLSYLYKLEKKLNKKYDIHNNGLNITMIGDISWKFGYKSNVNFGPLLPISLEEINNQHRIGNKIIRVYGWKSSEVNTNEEAIRYTKSFQCKYPEYREELPIRERKILCTGSIGAHAFFCKELYNNDAFGINFPMGTCDHFDWNELGLNRERAKQGYASGTELAIFLQKR